jgi:hypothetical protein
MKRTDSIQGLTLPVQPEPRKASALYLLRLRSHLSRGRLAVSDVVEAVSEVFPRGPWRKRNSGE